MKVLIIGASGFIGHYLRRRLTQNTGLEVTSTYNSRPPEDIDQSWYTLEITDQHRLQQIFHDIRPEVVVLLTAIADVKTAEIDQERATAVNVEGARQVARLCASQNARLVFLSSEYVFRGDSGYYKENTKPDPITHYGHTKWQAEQAIADEACQWSIVRTSIVFGWPITGRRNLSTVIINRLMNGQTFEGETGVYRTPIYVDHLAEGIAQLITNYHPGTFHMAGSDWINMYQFGHAVAKVFGLDSTLINPIHVPADLTSATIPLRNPEQKVKPDTLGLDCTLSASRLGTRTYSICTGLQEMLASG